MRRAALLVALALAAGGARGAERVAIVEDVAAPSLKLAPFAYLERGSVFALRSGERITIAYLSTCNVDVIVGGRVTVGGGRSTVEGGTVEREHVACDGGRLRLPASSATSGGAMVYRDPPTGGLPAPRLLIHGRAPIVEVTPRETRLVIERIDVAGPPLVLRLGPESALRPGVHDLARLKVDLAPGGLYRLSALGKVMVIAVATGAEARPRAGLSRFVPFRDLSQPPPKPAA